MVALLAANAISTTGNTVTHLAIPWFVLETTGSAARVGLVGAAEVVPIVIAGAVGGPLIDRLGFRRVSVAGDVLSGLTVAAIPLLHHTTGLAFWQLLALVFCGALLDAPGSTARAALLPDLAEDAGVGLERANTAFDAVNRLRQLVGPAIGGVLIVWLGTANVLWLDAASFAVSAAMVAALIPAARRAPTAPDEGFAAQVRGGWRFVWRHRLTRTLVLLLALTNGLDIALFGVLMPVFAREELGSARALGLLFAATGGGALLGSLLFGAFGHRLPRRVTYVGAFLLIGVQPWVLLAAPPLPLLLAAFACCAVGAGPLNPLLSTLWQETIPFELRGRVLGAIKAVAWGAMPLGALVAGFAVQSVGLRPTLLAGAVCFLVVTVAMAFNPVLREMDAPANPTPVPGVGAGLLPQVGHRERPTSRSGDDTAGSATP